MRRQLAALLVAGLAAASLTVVGYTAARAHTVDECATARAAALANEQRILAAEHAPGNLSSAVQQHADREQILNAQALIHCPAPPTTSTTVATTTSTSAVTTTTSTSTTTSTTAPPPPSAGVCTGRSPTGGVPADRFPGAACTGPLDGTSLTPQGPNDGSFYRITQAGVTLTARHFTATVCVAADNVTITNSLASAVVILANPFGHGGCGVSGGAHNLTLTDVEVHANSPSTTAVEGGVYGGGISCLRCDLHHAGAGINGGHYTLTDTYVHDLIGTGSDAHIDGIQGGGAGGNIEVTHSNIDAAFSPESQHTGGGLSCAICFYADNDFWGIMDDLLVQNTRIRMSDGGVYCVYAGEQSTNTRFIDNTFIREASTGTCGGGGPYTSRVQNSGDVWSGNHFDNGAPIL